MRRKHARKAGDVSEVPDPIDWSDKVQVDCLRWLCEQPTPEGLSALARHVLGYDSFKILDQRGEGQKVKAGMWRWKRGIFRTAGIVPWGPHRIMLATLNAPGDKVLFASRDAYKTTCTIVKIVQMIILNRDTRGIIYMETGKLAEKTVAKIRRCLERDEIKDLWGDFKGETDNWKRDSFTVCGREDDDRVATVSAAGTDVATVGDHVDWIWVDDPLSPLSAKSPTMVDRVLEGWRELSPLMDPGAFEIITLTPYVKGDVADHVTEQMAGSYEIARISCGMKAYFDNAGKIALKGYPNFVHLTEPYLLKMARKMGVPSFNRSYALSIEDDTNQVFRREDLLGAKWENRFSNLSAYIVTDTATSDAVGACQSVIAVVIMDWDDTAYVADMRVGRWLPNQLQSEFADLYLRWRSRVRICGVAIEKVSLNASLRSGWTIDLRARGISVNWIELRRQTQAGDTEAQGISKSQRILGSETRVRSHRLLFLDTMPRTCTLNGLTTLLYDPQGYLDASGQRLPGGEIVDQYIRWRASRGYKGTQDIPDCLAALDEVSHDGTKRMIPPSSRTAATMPVVTQARHAERRSAVRRDILARINGGA